MKTKEECLDEAMQIFGEHTGITNLKTALRLMRTLYPERYINIMDNIRDIQLDLYADYRAAQQYGLSEKYKNALIKCTRLQEDYPNNYYVNDSGFASAELIVQSIVDETLEP